MYGATQVQYVLVKNSVLSLLSFHSIEIFTFDPLSVLTVLLVDVFFNKILMQRFKASVRDT